MTETKTPAVRIKPRYSAAEMTNEDYHDSENGTLKDYISGTALCIIYQKSLSHWKRGEMKASPALYFGIASHAAILEPELFKAEFTRGFDKEYYKDFKHELPSGEIVKNELICTDAALKATLKAYGITKMSKHIGQALKEESLKRIPHLNIMDFEERKFLFERRDKVVVSPDDFDTIKLMRAELLRNDNPEVVAALKHMEVEQTFTAEIEGVLVKVKPDMITRLNSVWDYKTCLSAHPEKFAKHAYDYGYYLKMALQKDVIEKATGMAVPKLVLFAQEKTAPYIVKPWVMGDKELEIGRQQYKRALKLVKLAREKNAYPAYGKKPAMLTTPQYILKKYNLDDYSLNQ